MQEGKFRTESRELRRRRVGGPESVSSRDLGPVQSFWVQMLVLIEQHEPYINIDTSSEKYISIEFDDNNQLKNTLLIR